MWGAGLTPISGRGHTLLAPLYQKPHFTSELRLAAGISLLLPLSLYKSHSKPFKISPIHVSHKQSIPCHYRHAIRYICFWTGTQFRKFAPLQHNSGLEMNQSQRVEDESLKLSFEGYRKSLT